MKRRIDDGISRGNTHMDITGGEPTVYPDIVKLVEYAAEHGISTCIITNGIVSSDKAEALMAAGVEEWLVSRHGTEPIHNYITNAPRSFTLQLRFLDVCRKQNVPVRFNCVLTKFNENILLEMAAEMLRFSPVVVNFINMNPHHEWMSKDLATQDVIADLPRSAPMLADAIALLEEGGVRVNVRYYPMCLLPKKYWRCVANDLHVVWELYDEVLGRDINCEWDYQIAPKTCETHLRWARRTSLLVEEQGYPCVACDAKTICGGVNRHFHRVYVSYHRQELCRPIVDSSLPKDDFYFFRRHNRKILSKEKNCLTAVS